MPISLDKNQVKQTIENIENQNGTKIKDFSVKEIVILFHNDLSNKIDTHITWGIKENKKIAKTFSEHDLLFQKIMQSLPEKGFCDKTELIHADWFKNPKNTIGDKVNTLWYDRNLMKVFAVGITGALILGGVNLLFQIAL